MSKDAELLRAIGVFESDQLWSNGDEIRDCPISLGLDIPESEWTFEHDVAFAQWVWPWLRASDEDFRSQLHARFAQPRPNVIFDLPMGRFMAGWAFCDHPGPVMCRAIHAVLCGEKSV